jgi:uncharacterized SAM-binding protein YcdF (DUF218 family)
MRVIGISFAVLMVFVISLGVDFFNRATSTGIPSSGVPVAVVFSGQFDRVELGLFLMERKDVSELFITGVNGGAGIQEEGFATQFGLSVAMQAALADGRIILASDAGTTIENALETACWLAKGDAERSVVLITNRFHMPRASLALERAIGRQFPIERVFPEHLLPAHQTTFSWRELLKFAATWGITLMPSALWPSHISPDCTNPSQSRHYP